MTLDPTNAITPVDVTFIDIEYTGEIDTYAWVFGNGNTSSDPNPDPETYTNGGATIITYSPSITVTGPGGSTTYSVDVQIFPLPFLNVTKTVMDNPTPDEGDDVRFAVRVQNPSVTTATDVTVIDEIPPGLTFSGFVNAPSGTFSESGGTITWVIDEFPSGGDLTLQFDATVNADLYDPPSGVCISITNTASATTAETGGSQWSDGATIQVVEADVRVSITVDENMPDPGDTIVYTVILNNDGPRAANNIAVNIVLPGDILSSAVGDQGDYSGGVFGGTWNVNNLNSGGTRVLEITAQVDNAVTQVFGRATVAISDLDECDPITSNNSDFVDVFIEVTDLVIEKSVSPGTQNQGGEVTYTLTARNRGPMDATNVIVEDNLPAGVNHISDNSGGAYNPATGIWTIGTLNVGAVQTIQIVAEVLPVAGGVTTISNTAEISSPDVGNLGNHTDSASFTVNSADLVVAKAVDNAFPNHGDQITYTITVTNNGPQNATNVTVTDTLPEHVTYVTSSGGTFDAGTWSTTIPTLGQGGGNAQTYTITVTVMQLKKLII